jgi:hypothetical protein
MASQKRSRTYETPCSIIASLPLPERGNAQEERDPDQHGKDEATDLGLSGAGQSAFEHVEPEKRRKRINK